MANKFGGIELGGVLGGYEIVNIPADKLPQDIASAVSEANNNPLLGATYNPLWYFGNAVVNGVNHLFIAEDIRTTKNKDKSIVGLVINVPPGENAAKGEGAKVVQIIESADLPEEVQLAFDTATKQLIGVSYKAVIYGGEQTVRGTNHYIVCEAKGIYPNAQPYAVVMCINIFEGQYSIVGIAPLKRTTNGDGLFGYAFSW